MFEGFFLDLVSDSTRHELEAAGRRQRYPSRSYLFHEGDQASGVYLVEDGLVRIERSLKGGQTLLLALFGPNSLIGELAVIEGEEQRSATCCTVVDSRVLVVPQARFAELVSTNADLSLATARWIGRRLRAVGEQLAESAWATPMETVCSRLVQIRAAIGRRGDDGQIDLPISQAELAQWSGLSREAVVKVLRILRQEGVVESGRHTITVHDPAELVRRSYSPAR